MSRPSREDLDEPLELLDGGAEPERAPGRAGPPGAGWVPRLAAALVAVWALYVLTSTLVGG